MKKACLWFSHPFFENSRANKEILKNLCAQHSILPIRHIDHLYPDFKIDIATEQNTLLETELIILQFPIFWYSPPSSMVNWIDNVLTYNFAFGPKGDLLQNKELIISITLGSTQESYSHAGKNAHTIQEYLYGLTQLSIYCKMNLLGIVASYGYTADIDDEQREMQTKEHVNKLLQLI
ncbi:MAG: NAD(P)H-dependent oxidoreductase [Brevinemataceae bacterium]